MDKVEKNKVFKNKERILTKVKKFIDDFLNPSDKVSYRPDMTVDNVLHYLHIDKSEYYSCLSDASGAHRIVASSTIIIQLFYKLIWISNQFLIIIRLLRICVHICQRVKHIVLKRLELLPGFEREIKKIGAAFLNSREVSSQECVYRCLPELWLRKTLSETVFINTALPEQRVRTMKSKEQMAGLDDDSTESFNLNIIERYSDRPDRNFMNGIYSGVENLCLAEFAAFYYKQYQTEDDKANDN